MFKQILKAFRLGIVPVLSFFPAAPVFAGQTMIAAEAVVGYQLVYMDAEIDRYRALLVESEEGADLYIFVEADNGWTQAVHAKDIVWRGGIGQEPWLEPSENGSIRVYSENVSIGRNRWEQVLTIAFRNSKFLVAGYTYSYYDTLDPAAGGKCDVNLLTGKGVHNDKAFKTKLKALPANEWTMDTHPPECARD